MEAIQMVWFILAQVNLIGQNDYPGATWVGITADFSGDGVLDAYVFYGNDSVVIYDGLSSTPIGGYRAPAGYNITLYRIGYRTVLLYYYNYSDGQMQFQIYEDLNNLVYTSDVFNYSNYGYIYPINYDGDQYTDILVRVDSALYIYETTYSLNSKEMKPGNGGVIGRVDMVSGNGQLYIPVRITGDATLRVFDSRGKILLRREISGNRVEMNLPAGVYTYEISSPEVGISGKLIVR